MEFIIVTKGYDPKEYPSIRQDLTKQFLERGWGIPLFAHLPSAEYPELEIVWFDETIEQDNESDLLNLIREAWGALAWLEGTVELSDGARQYKAEKLREALEKLGHEYVGKDTFIAFDNLIIG